MRRREALIPLLAFALAGLPAYAQTGDGDQVRPIGDLPLRATPPSLFGSKGEQIGVVTPKNTYEIIDQRVVPTITGSENWSRVREIENPSKGKKMEDSSKDGWIFSGSKGGQQNLKSAK